MAVSWGAGLIEDDLATECAGQIVEDDSFAILYRTLSGVRNVPGHMSYEPAIRGLLAAEVVAALAGRPATAMPPELAAWTTARRDDEIDPQLRLLAAAVVERVKEDSEVAELWARSERLARWVASVDDLLARLAP